MPAARVYEREFLQVTGNPLVVPANEVPRTFEIGFPPEGELVKFMIKQVGGTARAAQCHIYDRLVTPVHTPGFSESLTPSGDPEMHKIVPDSELAVTSGQILEKHWNDGYYYRNNEGSYAVPVRKIYLEIDVTSPVDDTTWEVILGCKPATPGS